MVGRKTSTKLLAEKGELNPPVITRNDRLMNQMEAIRRVFGNPLLLDKIVEYTIYATNDKGFCFKDSPYSIRLVNKTWLQSASRVLITQMIVIKELSSNTDTSFQGVCYLNKNVMQNYISVFSEVVRLEYSILPLSFPLKSHYFIKENYKTLINLFEKCGDLVSTLDVNFPLNGGSMNLEFGRLNLPNLRTIDFTFDGQSVCPSIQTHARVSGTNTKGWTFLQQILMDVKKLKYFNLQNYEGYNFKHATSIGSLRLPTSITHIHLNCQLSSMELKLLITNKLPNLNSLNLHIFGDTQEEAHLIFKILDNFRTQLKRFLFAKLKPFDDEDDVICIKFPKMEKLTSLTLMGRNIEFYPEVERNLPASIPNVVSFVYMNVYETQVMKCIQDVRFEAVRELRFAMSEHHGTIQQFSNVQLMAQIQISFPNILKLTVHLDFSEMICLRYLFQNFIHLKELELDFRGDSDTSTGDELTSVLLGITEEEAKGISNGTENNPQVAADNPQSIMNLKELIHLTLNTLETPDAFYRDFYKFSKIFGFDKMPQLRKVTLLGGFKKFYNVE